MDGSPSILQEEAPRTDTCGENTVIIAGIPPDVTVEHVAKLFSAPPVHLQTVEIFKHNGRTCARLVYDPRGVAEFVTHLSNALSGKALGISRDECKGRENCCLLYTSPSPRDA